MWAAMFYFLGMCYELMFSKRVTNSQMKVVIIDCNLLLIPISWWDKAEDLIGSISYAEKHSGQVSDWHVHSGELAY